jgi:hypothetical protein
VEILQLPRSRRWPLANTPRLNSCFNWITRRLAAISHQPPRLRFTDWLTDFFFKINPWGHNPYITSSVKRWWICYVLLLLVLASAVILRSESRRSHHHILLSQIRDSPKPGGPCPRIYIPPGKRVAQLYPQAQGYLFIASYHSQGYVGGIRPSPPLVPLITTRHALRRKRRFQQFLYSCVWICCRGNMLVSWSLSNNGSTGYNTFHWLRLVSNILKLRGDGFIVLLGYYSFSTRTLLH